MSFITFPLQQILFDVIMTYGYNTVASKAGGVSSNRTEIMSCYDDLSPNLQLFDRTQNFDLYFNIA